MNLPKFPKITTKSLVAFMVIGGYVLAIGTLVWIEIPKDQSDIVDKALVGLGTLAGAIVNGLFQRKDNGE
jgi:hypothetical protein